MVCHMKTTLNIDDSVMARLRKEAARRGTTMSELVEAGLRLILDEGVGEQQTRKVPKLPSWSSGGSAVDLANREALYNIMDDD